MSRPCSSGSARAARCGRMPSPPARNFRVSVNHAMAGPGTRLGAGDEIAFFPPVTGG